LEKSDIEIFIELRKRVAGTFLKENTALSPDITQWKGDDILRFQEDLLKKVKAQVSEKWFYNYFRNDIQKLPRIDMLNLLSKYVGEKSWSAFKDKYSKKSGSISSKKMIWALLVMVVLAALGLFFYQSERTIQLCFVDENANPITESVQVVFDSKTGKITHQAESSCISFKTKNNELKFVIKAPYYKERIITRSINTSNYKEDIVLETDLYSLMLRHYSNSKSNDWKIRKQKLEKLIADDAIIYQRWYGKDKGVEIFTKEEFILQLIVPTSLLKNIEVIETQMTKGQINKLGFKVNR